MCPTAMQIYWNKRKCLHQKRFELPQDWFGTPTWPPFHCTFWNTNIATMTSCAYAPYTCIYFNKRSKRILPARLVSPKDTFTSSAFIFAVSLGVENLRSVKYALLLCNTPIYKSRKLWWAVSVL